VSTPIIVMGESGSGKTRSLLNLNPATTLLVQALDKKLSFKSPEWRKFDPATKAGNIFVTDDAQQIMALMKGTKRKVIVLDDFQYVLVNEFMRRSDQKGYDKFNDIGRNCWDILMLANTLPEDVRVYFMWHTQLDDFGNTKPKTVGKMLDDKVVIAGMVTICLKAVIQSGRHLFTTRNNGADTVKSPEGMFPEDFIENDLAMVDKAVCSYYGIAQ